MRKSVFAVRRENLGRLIADEFGGNQTAFGRHVGLSQSYVWCLFTDGKSGKQIGETVARRIEKKCRKGEFWLDEPDAVGKKNGTAIPIPDRHGMGNLSVSPPPKGKVPLLTWEDLERGDEGFGTTTGRQWMETQAALSAKNGFSIDAEGDSMRSDDPVVTFPAGTILILRVQHKAKSGDFVVARAAAHTKAAFKQYIEDSGHRYLRSLNRQYPMIEMQKDARILGVLVESYGPRKMWGQQ